MTTWDVLRALARRWYVGVAGLLLTVLVAFLVHTSRGVYVTTIDVHMVPPPHSGKGSVLENSLISLAGLVERELRPGHQTEQPVSPDVTIVDLGIEEGAVVFLPNSGGQWDYNFDQPLLRVSAAGADAAQAVAHREAEVSRIRATLDRIQAEDGAPAGRRVTADLVPTAPPVYYREGSRTQALALVVLLGGVFSVVVCVEVDRVLVRRRARLSPGSATPEPPAAPASTSAGIASGA